MPYGGNFRGGGGDRGGGFRRGGFRRNFHSEPTKITCAECGKEDTVPFKPREGSRVLCGDCFRKSKGLPPRDNESGKPGKAEESEADESEDESVEDESEEEFEEEKEEA